MKTIIALCAVLFCGVALADDGTVSVLNHGQPTSPAASPAPAACAPAACAPVAPMQNCENGQCRLQKTYTAQEQSHDFTRRRIMGGYVVRKGSRTVLRPVR